MRVVHERCAGLDVHKSSVVVCALLAEGKQLRTFGTLTWQLEQLAEWLHSLDVQVVAMESSGVYWKPVFNILEVAGFELLVVNARHIKAVPGRKTDVKDAEWLADLLRHGLLKPSFIPSREERELRELTRYRRTLIEERARQVQRLQKVLEGANIKLEDVISNVVGLNGRRFLSALVAGEYDPEAVAATANYGLQRKRELLAQALHGTLGSHQRFLLDQLLSHIDFLEQRITALDREVKQRSHPFEAAIAHLDQIPGVGTRAAEEILAEIGIDMSRFPSHRHLASWAKVCPGNNESPASDAPATPARAIAGCAPSWSNAPGAPPAKRTATSRPNTIGWPPGGAGNAPCSLSATACLPSSTTCCATEFSTKTLAPTTSTNVTAPTSLARPSAAWSASATVSPSPKEPPREGNFSG